MELPTMMTTEFQRMDHYAKTVSLTSSSDPCLGLYPQFLRQNFPGIKYALAYGSTIYPLERMGHSSAYVPNSKSRMLDLILVLPDHELPKTETTIIGSEAQWNIFNPVTRTAAQFHGANRERFPSHYPKKLRQMDLMELAKLQREQKCPILYFPLIRLPRAGNQSRDLWCKYGVISELDLINDLTKWEPFYLAGRTHKAFLSFDPSRDTIAKNDFCHIPPDSLSKALVINRIRAVQAALLLLPERFTFGTLLYTILSLSYDGDIRFPVAEDKNKITKLLHSQALPLSDIYLNLLLSTPGFIHPSLEEPKSFEHPASWMKPQTEKSTTDPTRANEKPKTDDTGRTFSYGENIKTTKLESNDFGRRAATASTAMNTKSELTAKTNGLGHAILKYVEMPSLLGSDNHISGDILAQLSQYHRSSAGNARDRLLEIGSGINPDRIDPISNEMREIKSQLLSEQFVMQQDKSDHVRDQLFATLPKSIRQASGDTSSNIRFKRLFSPFSLLSKERLNSILGGPLPRDEVAIQGGLKRLNRTLSLAVAMKSLKTLGTIKCAQYTLYKMIKSFRPF